MRNKSHRNPGNGVENLAVATSRWRECQAADSGWAMRARARPHAAVTPRLHRQPCGVLVQWSTAEAPSCTATAAPNASGRGLVERDRVRQLADYRARLVSDACELPPALVGLVLRVGSHRVDQARPLHAGTRIQLWARSCSERNDGFLVQGSNAPKLSNIRLLAPKASEPEDGASVVEMEAHFHWNSDANVALSVKLAGTACRRSSDAPTANAGTGIQRYVQGASQRCCRRFR